MFKLICKCCKKVLVDSMKEDYDLAEKILNRHLNFSNQYVDYDCINRADIYEYTLPYSLIEVTQEEKDQRRYKRWIEGANL